MPSIVACRPVGSERPSSAVGGRARRGFEVVGRGLSRSADARTAHRGFSLPELLVVAAVITSLSMMASAAVTGAAGSHRKLRTKAVIAKLHAIIDAQYASYAARSVAETSGTARGDVLRTMADGDLPDDWSDVSRVATLPATERTTAQAAYLAVWESLTDGEKQAVSQSHASAECLFLAVMYGGLADCIDCGSSRLDIDDVDADGMPEFVDAWGRPIGFILWPSGLRLPGDSAPPFFSAVKPFESIVPAPGDAKGGVMRPLLYSMGADGQSGLNPDASPVPGSAAHRDNLTNFDEEAKR